MNINKEKKDNSNDFEEKNDELNNNENENLNEEEDDRLSYSLITLGLENLIHIFEENSISFIDLLLLSKEDLIELQLEMYQRNRIYHFSKSFTKYAKNYSINEISDFFTFNRQFIFNSAIYDRVVTLNNDNEVDYQSTGTFFFNNNDDNNQKPINNISNLNHSFNEDNSINLNKPQIEVYSKKLVKKDNNNNNSSSKKNDNKNKEKISFKKKNKISSFNNNLTNDNYQHKRYNTDISNNKKRKNPINKNSMKSKRAFQKYLEIQQDADLILEKLNKQREDSEIRRLKYQNLLYKTKKVKTISSKKINKKNYYYSDLNDNNEEEEFKNNHLNNNNYNIEIDINEEYEKMIYLIEEIEKNKLDDNIIDYLNQIKSFINEKGVEITLEDIEEIINELNNILLVINNNKGNFKYDRNNNNKNKNIINDINNDNSEDKINNKENYFDTINNNVDEVEEVEEEYENDSNNESIINRNK